MLTYNEMMAECMGHKIFHDEAHGYSQYERSTNYSAREEIVLSDGTHVWIAAGDDDCSGSIRDNIIAVGLDPHGFTYTGNEEEGLIGSGQWVEISPGDAGNGDVVLREGHTEMVLDNDGQLAQGGFRISELGTIYGETGDQTGSEAAWSWYDPSAWEQAFHCIAVRQGAAPVPEVKPSQNPGEPLNNYGFAYRVHSQDVGWLDPVRDGQTAGTVGFAKRAEALKISPPKGYKLDVCLHIQDEGDKWYKGVELGKYDPEMGTTGQSRRIEGMQINVVQKTNKNLTLRYRVHIQDQGWTGWVSEGTFTGTRGKGLRVEAIEIALIHVQDYSEPKNNLGIKYRAHVENSGGLPEVHDGMIAGTTGEARRLEAIEFIDLPDGVELNVSTHIQYQGDIVYNGVKKGKKVICGTTGQGLRLEAISINTVKNITGKQLYYQGHIQDIGGTKIYKAGEVCGTKGKALRLESIKIGFE